MENKNTYNKNKRLAWKHFEKNGYAEHKGMVLHHIDVTLKQTDPERYAEWRIEDLVVMDMRSHRALHMKLLNAKGTFHNSKEHNANISKAIHSSEVRNKKVLIQHHKIVDTLDGEPLTFETLADAARYIGCSRQLICQCLKETTNNKRAMGYEITLID